MMNFLLVAAGGALGAGMRHLASGAVLRQMGADWPYATFSINVLGSFLLGLLAGWLALKGDEDSSQLRLLLGAGVLGGFTTFSAYSLEVVLLIERGRIAAAALYASGSVAIGIAFLFVGLMIARRVFA